MWHVCVLISHISVYCKQPTAHKVNDHFALFECVEIWIMSVIMRCSPSTLSSRVYLYSINSGLVCLVFVLTRDSCSLTVNRVKFSFSECSTNLSYFVICLKVTFEYSTKFNKSVYDIRIFVK